MHLNNNISQTQVKRLSRPTKFFNKADWNNLKKPQYAWADIEGQKYTCSVALTLQAFVACSNERGVSNATVKAVTNKRAKMVAGRPLSARTIARHISKLIIGKSIKRGLQKAWNATVRTVLRIKKKLSRQQHDKSSTLSISPLKGGLEQKLPTSLFGGGGAEKEQKEYAKNQMRQILEMLGQ